MRIVDRDGHRITGFGTRVFDELTNGRYVTLSRSELSRLLFEKLNATTEIIFGDEIVALREGRNRVEVQFKHGGDRRVDLVIGADGLHSAVRELAFGPQHQFEKLLGYGVAAFEAPRYRPRDEDIYVMHAHPGRMLGRFALPHDRTLCLFVFETDNRALPATIEEQKTLLRAQYRAGAAGQD